MIERRDEMICPNCKYNNSDESAFCLNCLLIIKPPPVLLPVANFIIVAAQSLVAEQITFEKFEEELQGVEKHLEEYRAQLNEMTRPPEEAEIVKKSRELLNDGFSMFSDSLAEMKKFITSGDKADLVNGLETILNASEKFFEVDVYAEITGKAIPAPVVCMKCSHVNPGGSKFCEKCNASLIVIPGTEPAPVITMKEGVEPAAAELQSSHFLRLKEVSEAVLKGEEPKEKLEEVIQWLKAILFSSDMQFKTTDFPSEKERAPEEAAAYNLMKEGISLYIKGVDEIKKFLADDDSDHVRDGLKMAQDASEKLIKVMMMSRVQK
ncbi:MAG: hypothetical protein M1536_09100 [Firmicutes bacterium]|nr:hypothetical protein [Bacillota bacterium]